MRRPLLTILALPLLIVACHSKQERDVGAVDDNGPEPTHFRFGCTPVSVHDGDTFTCADGTRIRVAGINAREIEWNGEAAQDAGCNEGAPCPTLDAVAARDRLAALLGSDRHESSYGAIRVTGPRLSCLSNGSSYDRIAAWCVSPQSGDISCDMVRIGAAARWDRYWRRHRCTMAI